MLAIWHRRLAAAALCAALLIASTATRGAAFSVVMDTSGFSGHDGFLVFDLIGNGNPINTVEVSQVASDGNQGVPSTIGSVSGTGPWTLSTAQFFNEVAIPFTSFGNTISFAFDASDHPPAISVTPDAFSVFLLDSTGVDPLFPTTDPTGAGSLFLLDMNGSGAAGLHVYQPADDIVGFSMRVVPVAVPEPGLFALLVAGAVALLSGRQHVRQPARGSRAGRILR